MDNGAPILEIDKVTKRFGGLTALDADQLLGSNSGEIRGLIGPNGAGKSTMFKNIAGFYTPTSGDIRYQRQKHQPADEAAQHRRDWASCVPSRKQRCSRN